MLAKRIIPCLDVRAGKVTKGVQFLANVDVGDPAAMARYYYEQGADEIVFYDITASSDGRRTMVEVVRRTAEEVFIPLAVGGGIRDATLLGRGVARVVVGSLAVEDPGQVRALAAAHPGRVAVGLDHRDGEVRVRGWQDGAGVAVADALAAVDSDGLAAVILTEIGRDGTLAGPDLAGLAAVLASTSLAVIASGGVASLDDLRALTGLRAGGRRLAGVIVGKAIYEGRFTLEDALELTRGRP